MKDHLHQPLLFNPAIYNSSDGKQHINYKYITMPQTMLVYAIDNTTGSASRKVSTLIPCSSAEWIIGYNKNNSSSSFYCIGPVSRRFDYTFGLYRRYFSIGWGYRDHEYHVCFRDGTYPGDRFANVHRGQGETYIVPIFDRINHHQCFRWNYRCGLGSRGGISTAFAFGMAGICFIVFRHHFILGLYVYRDILRLVSSPQSFPVKPDRCYSLRVII